MPRSANIHCSPATIGLHSLSCKLGSGIWSQHVERFHWSLVLWGHRESVIAILAVGAGCDECYGDDKTAAAADDDGNNGGNADYDSADQNHDRGNAHCHC